jgi:hypothetical protein
MFIKRAIFGFLAGTRGRDLRILPQKSPEPPQKKMGSEIPIRVAMLFPFLLMETSFDVSLAE